MVVIGLGKNLLFNFVLAHCGCKIIVAHCVQKWGGNFYISGRDDIVWLDARVRECQIDDTGPQSFPKRHQSYYFFSHLSWQFGKVSTRVGLL